MPKERRRRYQSYSRPQSYLDPLSSDNRMAPVDITGTLLKEVRAFGDEIIETSEEKDIFRSNEKKRQDDLNKKILETKRIDKENPLNSLASEFNNQLNEIQKASLDAFKRGGNMDDVKRMEDNLNSSIDGVLEVTAGLDAIGNPIRDLDDSGLDRNVLYSQFEEISDGIDPSKRELFLNVLQNPSRVNYKFNEGDWIIQYKNDDGSIVDAFNGSEIKNAIKDGFEVIKMADDDSKRIQDLSAEVSKGLDDIVSQEVITAYKDSNKTLTTTQKTNYEKALKKMDERLENDPAFEALITESNYQMYVNKKDRLDSKGNYIQFGDVDSYKKTKEALKNKIIDSKFPGGARVLNKIIKKPASSSGKNDGSDSKTKSYSKIINNAAALSDAILNPQMLSGQITDIPNFPDQKVPISENKKIKALKNTIKKDLNNLFSLRRIGNKKIIQDFDIAFNESSGQITIFPKVQIPGEEGLSIQEELSQGIVLNDNNLFKLDKLLGGVDGKTSLQETQSGIKPLD